MINKQPLGRRALLAPLSALLLGACSSVPLNPENDETVAQRIARHPEPWVIDENPWHDAYVTEYFEGRLFFLSPDSLTRQPGVAKRDDCMASLSNGEKVYSLCLARDPSEQTAGALKLLSPSRKFVEIDTTPKQWTQEQLQVPVETCNDEAHDSGANFYSFDAENEVCLAIGIIAHHKATIERDELAIKLIRISTKKSGIGAAVATGGPRPM